jgi:hypothetical protein
MRLGSYSLVVFALLTIFSASAVKAQIVVDKTVATVSDGARTELITYSDLLWELALQPGVPLDPPSEENLRRALQITIDQRIFALEAQRLPRAAPTEAEIADKIAKILERFASPAEFERRLKTVGFSSIKDDNFEIIIAQRIAIEKYLDFRFKSFVVVTADDESNYYRDTWVPEFRRLNPNAIVPTLAEARGRVNEALIESRVEANMEVFLEEAKRRVEVAMLTDVIRK